MVFFPCANLVLSSSIPANTSYASSRIMEKSYVPESLSADSDSSGDGVGLGFGGAGVEVMNLPFFAAGAVASES